MTSVTKSPLVWMGRVLPFSRRRMNQAIGLSSDPEVRMVGSLASAG